VLALHAFLCLRITFLMNQRTTLKCNGCTTLLALPWPTLMAMIPLFDTVTHIFVVIASRSEFENSSESLGWRLTRLNSLQWLTKIFDNAVIFAARRKVRQRLLPSTCNHMMKHRNLLLVVSSLFCMHMALGFGRIAAEQTR